jgi:hypothetical protein
LHLISFVNIAVSRLEAAQIRPVTPIVGIHHRCFAE